MDKNSITRGANKVAFTLKKHSPEILMVAGIAGTVGACVLACRSTLKIHEVMEEHNNKLNDITVGLEEAAEGTIEYDEEAANKDTAMVYVQTGMSLARLYAPAIALGVFSISCLVGSNRIMKKREVSLMAAYTTLDQMYKRYRANVVEKYGKDEDRNLKFSIKQEEIEEKIVDDKGKEKIVKKNVESTNITLADYSDYARFFDEASPEWEKDPEYNLHWLGCQQKYFNDLLIVRGHVFLNEVYDRLGIPRTRAGQRVGWIYDKKNPVGDNCIDFGIYNAKSEAGRAFVNGTENVILLDFNVDGDIWDKI